MNRSGRVKDQIQRLQGKDAEEEVEQPEMSDVKDKAGDDSDSGGSASAKSEPSESDGLSSVIVIMLVLQVALYGCTFAEVATTQFRSIFWLSLAIASFLGMVQIVYLFMSRRADGGVGTHIVSISVTPIVVFVTTWIFTLGITELALAALDLDIDLHFTGSEEAVFTCRGVSYVLVVMLCVYLYCLHLSALARTFGKTLGQFCVPAHWDLLQEDDDDDDDDDVVDTDADGSHVPITFDNTVDAPQQELQRQPSYQAPVVGLIILQAVNIGLQVPSGMAGIFPAAFLATFGLSCAVLAILVCYIVLLRASNMSNSRSLLRIWTAMPLVIVLTNSWCFCTQLVEFVVSHSARSFGEIIDHFDTTQLVQFIVMVVSYLILVIVGMTSTRIHLNELAVNPASPLLQPTV